MRNRRTILWKQFQYPFDLQPLAPIFSQKAIGFSLLELDANYEYPRLRSLGPVDGGLDEFFYWVRACGTHLQLWHWERNRWLLRQQYARQR